MFGIVLVATLLAPAIAAGQQPADTTYRPRRVYEMGPKMRVIIRGDTLTWYRRQDTAFRFDSLVYVFVADSAQELLPRPGARPKTWADMLRYMIRIAELDLHYEELLDIDRLTRK